CGSAQRERLAARRVERDRMPAGCTLLFTHNAAVDEITARALARRAAKTLTFAMTAKGADPLVQALKRGCLSPETLQVKEGAVVMFTKNDPAGRYVNGTLGLIEGFDPDEGHPVVRTRRGARI